MSGPSTQNDKSLTRYAIYFIIAFVALALLFYVSSLYDSTSKKQRTNYSLQQVYDYLDTGDVLLYSSPNREGVVPGILRKVPFGTEFTHVGLIYRNPRGEVFVWELSAPDDHVHDALSGRDDVGGIKLIPLQQRLANYRGYIVATTLQPRLSAVRSRDEIETIMQRLFRNASGPTGRATLGGKVVSIAKEYGYFFRPVTKSMARRQHYPLCSEVIAYALKELGVLNISDHDTLSYLPHHFDQHHLGRFQTLQFELSLSDGSP